MPSDPSRGRPDEDERPDEHESDHQRPREKTGQQEPKSPEKTDDVHGTPETPI